MVKRSNVFSAERSGIVLVRSTFVGLGPSMGEEKAVNACFTIEVNAIMSLMDIDAIALSVKAFVS